MAGRNIFFGQQMLNRPLTRTPDNEQWFLHMLLQRWPRKHKPGIGLDIKVNSGEHIQGEAFNCSKNHIIETWPEDTLTPSN